MVNRNVLTLITLLLLTSVVRSQDLFDPSNSLKYASHLVNSGQYDLAAAEYERLIFTYNPGDSINHLLFRTYILSGKYSKVTDKMNHLYLNPLSANGLIARDYAYSMALSGKHSTLKDFISVNPGLTAGERVFFLFNSQLLDNKWQAARLTFESLPDSISFPQYTEIFSQINNVRYKSYPLAIGLSAVIPGMGKVYSGDWKDGIISFVFVAGMSLQAWRGYTKYGAKSGHYIGYASLAGIFYISNLYGTYRSVNKHNESAKQKIQNHIRSTFISAY